MRNQAIIGVIVVFILIGGVAGYSLLSNHNNNNTQNITATLNNTTTNNTTANNTTNNTNNTTKTSQNTNNPHTTHHSGQSSSEYSYKTSTADDGSHLDHPWTIKHHADGSDTVYDSNGNELMD